MKNLLSTHNKNKKIDTLIENMTRYSAGIAELDIFDTFEQINNFKFVLDKPFLAGMLNGKKIINTDNNIEGFEFLPGESLLVPAKKEVIIDFPEASMDNPTQCLVLTIDQDIVNQTVDYFNSKVAIENENNNWQLYDNQDVPAHLIHNENVNQVLNRILDAFVSDDTSKDMIVELAIKELIIRLLQTKARQLILHSINAQYNDTRIGEVVKYIKQHLTDKNIKIDDLAKIACMSTSHFYKQFKNTLDISPIDYINSERIKFAKKLLAKEKNPSITEVAYKSGFNSVSYFNRMFKKYEMITPTAYVKALKSKSQKTKENFKI